MVNVEPIPESLKAMEALVNEGAEATVEAVFRIARRVEEIVPECVGLSLAIITRGLTFTLVATTDEAAGLDAVQYLDGGPCVASAHESSEVEVDNAELFDEGQWQMYADSSAAAGVRSSLTLPVLGRDGAVVGTVNMYASTPEAFDLPGRRQALAGVAGSSAERAVANADLSFSTRLDAMAAPEQLVDSRDIDIAVGMISARQGVDVNVARERLNQAALRAGITQVQAARTVKGLHPG